MLNGLLKKKHRKKTMGLLLLVVGSALLFPFVFMIRSALADGWTAAIGNQGTLESFYHIQEVCVWKVKYIFLSALLILVIVFSIWNQLRVIKQKIKEKRDPISGGYTAEYFERWFSNLARRERLQYSVVYVGLDSDEFEEKVGHPKRDDLIKYVVNCLEDAFGEMVFTLSPTRFVVLCKSMGEEQLEHRCRMVLKQWKQCTELGCSLFFIEANVGICQLTGKEETSEQAMFRAKQAYRYAKNRELDLWIADATSIAELKRADEFESKMYRAVEDRLVSFFLQPFYCLKTGKINGFEALARWRDQDYGMVLPDRFIPILEKNKWVEQMDLSLLEKICALIHSRNQTGLPVCTISCNFSRNNFLNPEFASKVLQLLKKYQVRPDQILIEVTESCFVGTNLVLEKNIRQLRDSGISLSIDDFGAGYSSFNDLDHYPAEYLKLDKCILDKAREEKGRPMLKSMIHTGHSRGMKVFCEGVEQLEQVQLLRECDCDLVQGFYYFPPLPPEEALILLEA